LETGTIPIFLKRCDLGGLLVVDGLELDLKLGPLDLHRPQDLSLVGGQRDSLAADGVIRQQTNLTVVQLGRKTELSELGLHRVRESSQSVETFLPNNGFGSNTTGASELGLLLSLQQSNQLSGLEIRCDQGRQARNQRGQGVDSLCARGLGGEAQSDLTNLILRAEHLTGLQFVTDALQDDISVVGNRNDISLTHLGDAVRILIDLLSLV